ncbi:hypothetical protein QAD02_022291 [Eretmocerus hayati]|uniref:Uncharacterized protein n=1 Tax=Eretmocerus hayati TaxID=131215 RepID=A0ACC2PSU9_9HYME|nr:hypothetical protein QAD02_022291 [Eretmocerus hayati]
MQLVQVAADHHQVQAGGAAAATMQVATQPQLAAAYPAPTAYYDAASGSYYYECPMMLVPATALPADQMGCIAALPCAPMPTLRPIEWIEPGALVPAKPGTPQPGYCYVDYQTAQVTDCATLVDAHGAPLSVSASPVPMLNGHHHHRPEQSLTGGSCCSASASASASANGSVVDEPVLVRHPSPEPQLVVCVTPSPVHLYESPSIGPSPQNELEEQQEEQQGQQEQQTVPEVDEAVPSVSEPEDTAVNEECQQPEQLEQLEGSGVPQVEECEVLEYTEVSPAYVETLPPQPMHLTHVIAQPMGQPYIYPGQYMFGPPLINMNGVTIQGGPMLRCSDILMGNAAAAACVRRKKKKKKRKQRRAQAFGNTDYEDEEDYSSDGENGYSSSRVSWTAPTSTSHTKQQLNPECQEFRLRGEQLNPECEEFHPPPVIEYTESQEFHPTTEVEYHPTTTVEYQPSSTVDFQPTATVEYQPTPTVEYQPTSAVEYQPTSTVEYQTASTVEYQTTSAVAYHPTSTVEYQTASTVEYQPTSTVEYHSSAVVEYQPTTTVEYHPTSTVEYNAASSTDYHTTSTSEYHSSPASDYHAESQAEYHSASAVEYDTAPTAEYHTASGVEYHSPTVTEYHNNGTTEYIPTSTVEYHPTAVGEYHSASATEYLSTSTPEYHPTSATEYHTTSAAEYHTTPASEYHAACTTEYHTTPTTEYHTAPTTEYHTSGAEYITTDAAEYHPMTAVEYDNTASANEYHQTTATEYHATSAVEYDTNATEYVTAEYPSCEEYHPVATEEIQYVAVPVESDGLPTEYYSYETIPTSVPTAMPIESNGYGEIVTSVEYAEEPTEEYIPENSIAISHVNNEAERLTYEESTYGDSAYHYCEQPAEVEYAQYCDYGETLDQCHQPYDGLTNGDLTIYQNGHESELMMNGGEGIHYGEMQEHPDMAGHTDLQRLPSEMVDRPMGNGNDAHRRKYNSKVKYAREPTPGPDLASQGACCGGDITNNTIAVTNNDDGSVEAVTEMLKSTSIAETQAPQKGGDQDNCRSWINEISITSEIICNKNIKTTTDLETTLTKTTLTMSATDEDSGFESHTSKTGTGSCTLASRPITNAVNEWLKRANSPDLFITSSAASDDSEDDQDEEDASVKSEPPKNLQGNPMPALSVNTGAKCGRPVARDQLASSANQSTPNSSHQRAIGGPERRVSPRKSRKTKALRKRAAVDRNNATDYQHTSRRADAMDVEYLQISAKPERRSISQEKIGGTCEVIGKDSDVGMRVAENSRIPCERYEKVLNYEVYRSTEELEIVKPRENAGRSYSIGETAKTFEKGEIVVSMDGELLLVTTAPSQITTKDSIDTNERKDSNSVEDDDENGLSLGSIEEPDVLECWEAEITEPLSTLTQVLDEDIADEDLAAIDEDNNNTSEHVQKYYRLQVDSCIEDDDPGTTDINANLQTLSNMTDQSSDSEDENILPVITEEQPQSIGSNQSNVPVDEAFEARENNNFGKRFPFDSTRNPRFGKTPFFRRRPDGTTPFENVSCNIQ